MNRIKEILLNIVQHHKFLGRDKLEHFYTASIGFLLFSLLFNPVWASIIVGLIALGKEIVHDVMLEKGKGEVLDAIMSLSPIIIYWSIQQ